MRLPAQGWAFLVICLCFLASAYTVFLRFRLSN
jgi:hypothetical protein